MFNVIRIFLGTFKALNPTDSADCLLASNQQNLFHIYLMLYVQSQTPWWWTERPSETCRVLLQNKINLRKWCISLVLL
jgi:hypothetical protein